MARYPDGPDAIRERLGRLAWLLDSSIVIPGTRLSIGVEALIGLVPGLGDAAGVLLSGYIVREAARLGVPRATLVRMLVNVLVEGIVGLVPFAGDVFDAIWKANVRNVALLDSHFEHPRKAAAASRMFVALLFVALLALFVGILALGFFLLRWLFQ
jgi:hypothetical protein